MKKRSFLAILLSVIMITSMLPLSVFAAEGVSASAAEIWDGSVATEFASGSGTEDDPFIIMTAPQLALLAAQTNGIADAPYENAYFELGADIALNDTTEDNWYLYPDVNVWTPIGFGNSRFSVTDEYFAFSGRFDGKGFTVSGMYISDEADGDRFGLFGSIYYASVANVNVKGSRIDLADLTESTGSAGIVGTAESSVIEGCTSDATVSSYDGAGGITGCAYKTTVKDCKNTGIIVGEYNVGGIVGYADASTVSDCTNLGLVGKDAINLGGIAGYAYDSSVTSCANKGAIFASEDGGGIAGEAFCCEITECYNNATVNVVSYGGGIIGYSGNDSNDESSFTVISECYNKGNVYGENTLGGIVACAWFVKVSNSHNLGNVYGDYDVGGFSSTFGDSSSIDCCFTTGKITATDESRGGAFFTLLSEDSTVSNCFWLMGAYKSSVGQITDINSANVKKIRVIAPEEFADSAVFSGYDFETVWTMGTNGPELASLKSTYRTPYVEVTEFPSITEEAPPEPEISSVILAGVSLFDGDYLANGATRVSASAPAEGGYAYYNDGTLTLNNFEYEGVGSTIDDMAGALYLGTETKLVLYGESLLTNTSDALSDCYGINTTESLTISGKGSLTLNAGIAINDNSGRTLTLDSGTVNANGTEEGVAFMNIYVNGGSLNADASVGIYTHNLIINSGSVTSIGKGVGVTANAVVANGGSFSAEATSENGVAMRTDTPDSNDVNLVIGENMRVSLPESGVITDDTKAIVIEESDGYSSLVLGNVPLKDGDYLASGATNVSASAPAEGGYAYYSDGVLTLNNFVLENQYYTFTDYGTTSMALLHSAQNLEIVLVGENTLIGGEYVIGIFPAGEVTISGEGSLVIDTFAPIHTISSGTVNIEGGNITLGDTQGFNYFAVSIETLNVTGGTLNANGISGETLNIQGGDVTFKKTNNYAVKVDLVKLDGGRLTAESTSNSAFSDSCELVIGENMKVVIPANGVIGSTTTKAVIEEKLPEPVYDLYVFGVGLDDGDYLSVGATETTDTPPEQGGYAYYKDGVLTLNEVECMTLGHKYEVSPNYYSYAAIYSEKDLVIRLAGDVSIKSTYEYGEMIYVKGALSIIGDGTLATDSYYGITADTIAIDTPVDIVTAGGAIFADECIINESLEILMPENDDVYSAAHLRIDRYEPISLGDVDGNGEIDQFDYLLVKRAYFNTYDLTEDEQKRADVNSDNTVDQFDYMMIKRHYFETYVIG